MPIEPPLNDFKTYPKMAHWFSPWLLAKLLNNVATSSMFGKYADRRLIVAALDTVPAEEHFKRAEAIKKYFEPDDEGAVWFDFVADLGDGFDSTYAVANLLGREKLTLDGVTLPRGQVLLMGGDEVYPSASSQAYRNQMWQPYAWAFPDHDKKNDEGVPVFAIPGNHDWYDGLVLFLAYFCREKHLHMGSWRSHQRRSYFAFQITEKWWVWAVDIQLADNIDQPQYDYFRSIARQMPDDSKIILCSAEPGWLCTEDTTSKSWDVMGFAIRIAQEAKKGFDLPILLSGDTHHYSRYDADDGKQFITSGGGGAFLHPTHQLAETTTVAWSGKKKLTLGKITSSEDGATQPACYPPKLTSWLLTWRNLWFAFSNWDFSLLMGTVYWIIGIVIAYRDQWDAYLIITAVFGAAFLSYTIEQEKSKRPSVLITTAIHTVAQAYCAIALAQCFAGWNAQHPIWPGEWYSGWIWLLTLLVQMGIVGGLVGSTLYGWNMLYTCLFFRMNRNDAFSSFRLGAYNNFLRIKIKGDQAEVYAIGLKDVPRRDQWRPNPKATKEPVQGKKNSAEPIFIVQPDLAPHLIEKVTVSGANQPP